MKRNINTNVLHGFLNQAISHNKYLEESEMWKKKRELDNEPLKNKSSSYYKKTRLNESSDEAEPKKTVEPKKNAKNSEEIDDLQVLLALYKDTQKKPVEKWGHSGYEELYPDHDRLKTNSLRELAPSDNDRSRLDTSSQSESESEDRAKKKKSKHRKSSSSRKHKKKHSKHKKKKKKKLKE